jgi:hypothetical protein
MNILTPIKMGQIIPVPNMRKPKQGAQGLPIILDFSVGTSLQGDLTSAFLSGEFDFAQSVYIDNQDSSSTLVLTFPGGGPKGHRIIAQPFSQGYYPCSPSVGDGRFVATSAGGVQVPVTFYNVAMPFVTWGPTTNAVVVPTLQNVAFAPLMLNNGNNQLVAGIGGETVKFYRGIFQVDGAAILTWTDGPGGAVLFTVDLTVPGASATFQATNVPWWNATSVGNDLTLNSNAAVNLYGGFGYAQS